MSRKLDWADKEARALADVLGIDTPTAHALLAAVLRLAYERGVGEGIDRLGAAVDRVFARNSEERKP